VVGQQRIAVFLSAMRHFAEDVRAPVLQSLRAVATQHGLALDLRDDTHFFSTVCEFAAHADGRKQLRPEYCHRERRDKHGILMEGKAPVGGQWNFDADNREAFGIAGPQNVPLPTRFAPDAITQTLKQGYAHHIQGLMVTGLYALLMGVKPQAVRAWCLSVYVEAVEWVELPSALGMGQFGGHGLMASKPYVASGKYILRMSKRCKACKYDPAQSTGTSACPYTTLVGDFLMRHEDLLSKTPRMAVQLKNLARLDAPARNAITTQATAHRDAQI
jgi:deoxyribodipyrimidine photolyase-like uncharacterized protein